MDKARRVGNLPGNLCFMGHAGIVIGWGQRYQGDSNRSCGGSHAKVGSQYNHSLWEFVDIHWVCLDC